jgi:hypothetical protein
MTERRCGTCRWHDVEGFYRHYKENAEGMGDMGFCRRAPPLPDFIVRWSVLQRGGNPSEEFVWAVWPETSEEDWCGEWQAEEPSAP